jgi:tRNA(fMet)-specific endonuclease VapC
LEWAGNRADREKEARVAIQKIITWPYTRIAGEEFGRLRALLRRIGRPMQIIDIQLAAIPLTLGNTIVVSADSDLLAVPGLTVENWATP